MKHDSFTGTTLDSQYAVGTPVKSFHFIIDAAIEGGVRFDMHSEIWPSRHPLNVLSAKTKINWIVPFSEVHEKITGDSRHEVSIDIC